MSAGGRPYPKLPFREAVSLSYSSYFANFGEALRASWLWLVITAAVMGLVSWEEWTLMPALLAKAAEGSVTASYPAGLSILFNLAAVLPLFAGVSIAVAWHRFLILHEHPGVSGSNIVSKNLWRYIGIALAIFLIAFLPPLLLIVLAITLFAAETAAGQPSPGLAAFMFLAAVLYFIGIVFAFRLSLLLPATAVGDTDLTFKQTWNRTEDNTWRLFWGVVFTTTPLLLLAEIVSLLLIGSPNPQNFANPDFAMRMTIISTIFNVYYLLILPIGIGFLSHAYRHFFRGALHPAP
jgi:hypothetical protein